jgi:hypothetical protein
MRARADGEQPDKLTETAKFGVEVAEPLGD